MFALCRGLIPTRNKQIGNEVISACSRMTYRRDTRSKWEEVTIPSPWGDISGKWWGSKESQPILSVHGWEDNAASFDRIAPHLECVLALDLPGHGFSSFSPLATSYNFMDGVTLLRYIIRNFKWREITLMGHSYGGALAFAYAGFFPNTVKNLITIECLRSKIALKSEFVSSSLKKTIECILSPENLVLEDPPVYSLDDIVEMWQKCRGKLMTKEISEVLLSRCLKEVSKGKYMYLRDPRLKEMPLGLLTNDLLYACAPRINCQVLSILANPGLDVAHCRDYEKTKDLIRESAFYFEEHTVKGSHYVHLEKSVEIAQIISNFLTKSGNQTT